MNVTAVGADPVYLDVATVGVRFFDLLGVRPQLGRSFAAGEDATGASRVAVLSDHLWRNNYGADRRIVGQTIRLDGDPYTVVGIAPRSLTFPTRVDLYVPLVFQPWQTSCPGSLGQ